MVKSGAKWGVSTLSTEFSTIAAKTEKKGEKTAKFFKFFPKTTKFTQKGANAGMLYGRFQHNIDAKGRLFVPAKLREKLGMSFIAAAVMDHCVCLYSVDEWDKLQAGLAEMPLTKARKLQRYLSANAVDAQVDSQGRILLPKHLLDYANLEKEALVIGAGNRAEIWNPAAYEADMETMTSEEVEAEFMELGF